MKHDEYSAEIMLTDEGTALMAAFAKKHGINGVVPPELRDEAMAIVDKHFKDEDE